MAEQGKAATKIEYVEVPGITETFADSIHGLAFDGQTFRVEFCVTRMDEPKKGGETLTGRRLTACRMVLSPAAALQLSTKLGRMLGAMARQNGARAQRKGDAAPTGEAVPGAAPGTMN